MSAFVCSVSQSEILEPSLIRDEGRSTAPCHVRPPDLEGVAAEALLPARSVAPEDKELEAVLESSCSALARIG